jgi:hypothetical protein
MLKPLRYDGFVEPSTCHYAIGELDGKPAVVFVQGPLSNTGITNVIEVLASRVLAAELAGRQPADVRFFEHYPPALNPIREWQEVTFKEVHPVPAPADGWIARLRALVAGERSPRSWAVAKPQWHPIATSRVPPALTDLLR